MLRWTLSDDWAAIDGGFGFVGTLLGSAVNQDRSLESDNVEGFGLLKVFVIEDLVRLRLQTEGVMIDSKLEYNYSLTIDAFLNLFGR